MSEVANRARKALRDAAADPRAARAALQKLIESHPNDPAPYSAMGELMMGAGDLNAAAALFGRWVALTPKDSRAHEMMGRVLVMGGQGEVGVKAFTRAVELDPKNTEAHGTLAVLHMMAGRSIDMEEVCRAGLAAKPGDARLTMLLGRALMNSAQAIEAAEVLRAGLKVHPTNVDIAESLAVVLNYSPGADPVETLEAHKKHAALAASRHRLPRGKSPTDRNPDRPLRIGLLSADLRGHSVGFFIEPLIERLSAEHFSTYCYSTGAGEDQTTERLRALSSDWKNVKAMEHATLARTINADSIDILIDLAGLSLGHRVATLASKPAPLIITYLGYPNTTGCPGVDSRIVDSITDPSPTADTHATERLIRLDPCFLCYRPPQEAPAVEPRAPGALITFGSFNSLPKHHDDLFKLWSRVLAEVPGSRLVIKNAGLIDARTRDAIAQRLIRAGIPAERFELTPYASAREDHLKAYHTIDIALDTFPYHGTTTTCEALHMGIPVVTMEGTTHASRVGVSLLSAIGCPELIASSEDDFAKSAVALARDTRRLADYRRTLRDRLLTSPLCDADTYAARFGAMLRNLWRDYCSKGAR